MKAVVCVDLNWGIGYRGKLLARIPEDMRLFRRLTLGKTVIMGRGTFESLPAPLEARVNIVLSRSLNANAVLVCRSLDELFLRLEAYPADDVFVIGGEAIYSQLLPHCTQAYVTEIAARFDADRHFADLNQDESWVLRGKSDYKTHHDLRYRFLEYFHNG